MTFSLQVFLVGAFVSLLCAFLRTRGFEANLYFSAVLIWIGGGIFTLGLVVALVQRILMRGSDRRSGLAVLLNCAGLGAILIFAHNLLP